MEQINLRHQVLQKRTIKSVCDGPILKNGPSLKFWSNTKRAKSDHSKCFTSSAVRNFLPEPWLWLQMVYWHSRCPNMSLLWENTCHHIFCFRLPWTSKESAMLQAATWILFQVGRNTEICGSRFLLNVWTSPPPKKSKTSYLLKKWFFTGWTSQIDQHPRVEVFRIFGGEGPAGCSFAKEPSRPRMTSSTLEISEPAISSWNGWLLWKGGMKGVTTTVIKGLRIHHGIHSIYIYMYLHDIHIYIIIPLNSGPG